MKEQEINPVRFSLIAGSILMALPTFFWIGVVLEVFFKFTFIVKRVMLPIDQLSPLLSVMIMVGLPLITIMINLKTMLEFNMEVRRNDLEFDIRVNRNLAQWMLLIYASLSIVGILTYAFFENFKLFSAYTGL